jgi:hypothetical protein
MGWTSFNMRYSVKGWFIDHLESAGTLKVLDVAIVKYTQLYAAVEIIKTKQVFAAVYMLSFSPKSYYNFSYKDMDETCGPWISECPERILKLLSPLTETERDGYAKEWRERCWKQIEKKKILKGNHIFKSDHSIHFSDNNNYLYFKKEGRKIYAGKMENNLFKSICRVTIDLSKHNVKIV